MRVGAACTPTGVLAKGRAKALEVAPWAAARHDRRIRTFGSDQGRRHSRRAPRAGRNGHGFRGTPGGLSFLEEITTAGGTGISGNWQRQVCWWLQRERRRRQWWREPQRHRERRWHVMIAQQPYEIAKRNFGDILAISRFGNRGLGVSRTAPEGVHRRGALPLIQPKPRPRVTAFIFPRPMPSTTGCVGWCFPRRPAALGSARGACSCGLPPTPSAPDACLSRDGAPPPSPTPRVNITEHPPQPPLR